MSSCKQKYKRTLTYQGDLYKFIYLFLFLFIYLHSGKSIDYIHPTHVTFSVKLTPVPSSLGLTQELQHPAASCTPKIPFTSCLTNYPCFKLAAGFCASIHIILVLLLHVIEITSVFIVCVWIWNFNEATCTYVHLRPSVCH